MTRTRNAVVTTTTAVLLLLPAAPALAHVVDDTDRVPVHSSGGIHLVNGVHTSAGLAAKLARLTELPVAGDAR